MPDHSTVARPIRWSGALLTFAPFSAFVAIPWAAGLSLWPTALMVGAWGFVLYRIFVVRFGLCRDHRRGVIALKRGKFHDGLAAFERSEAKWAARPTLDRFRAVLLGSATPWRFHTLARYNRAYALSRLGRGEDSLELLNAVLDEDPTMTMAAELRDVLLAGSALHPEVGRAMTE